MTSVQMTAEIVDGNRFETVHYPDDEIMLRVTEGGSVQVIEYHSTDRDGRALPSLARDRIRDRG